MVSLFGVTPGYFAAMSIRLERGRFISEEDRRGLPMTAVISRGLAERFWPGQDPIGRRIRQGPPDRPWITIVGIVGDVRHNGLDVSIKEKFYRPHTQFPASSGFAARGMNLVVKTAGDPLALAAPIRAEVRTIDPSLPIANVRTMEEVVAASMARPRLAGSVLILFAVVALLLAAVGLYGVLAYVVSERRHEFGIRLAIGADAADVRRTVLLQGFVLAGGGVCAGAALSLALGRLIRGLLYGVSAHDPATFAVVPAVLLGVGLLASWIPAHRVTRIDPIAALKAE